jgi:hypothetical protein
MFSPRPIGERARGRRADWPHVIDEVEDVARAELNQDAREPLVSDLDALIAILAGAET